MLNQYPAIIYEPQWMKVSIETIKDKKELSLYSKIYPVYPLDTETVKIEKVKYPYVHFMIHDETQCFGRQEIGNMDKDELEVLNLILCIAIYKHLEVIQCMPIKLLSYWINID